MSRMDARTVIKNRLTELDVSPAYVARLARVDADGLTRWLVGRRETIHVSTLEPVAEVLGLSLLPCIRASVARNSLR